MAWECWPPWGTTKTLWTRWKTSLLWTSWKRVWRSEPDRNILVPWLRLSNTCLPNFSSKCNRRLGSLFISISSLWYLPSVLLNQTPTLESCVTQSADASNKSKAQELLMSHDPFTSRQIYNLQIKYRRIQEKRPFVEHLLLIEDIPLDVVCWPSIVFYNHFL